MGKLLLILIAITGLFYSFKEEKETRQWIRINQLGYTPNGTKVAVWCSKESQNITSFELVDSATRKIVYKQSAGKDFGTYGPFTNTYRLNFSLFKKPGTYFLRAGKAVSPLFKINDNVYKGTADFCLQYM